MYLKIKLSLLCDKTFTRLSRNIIFYHIELIFFSNIIIFFIYFTTNIKYYFKKCIIIDEIENLQN